MKKLQNEKQIHQDTQKKDDTWINWKVEFKPGTTEKQINSTKTKIDSHITKYISKVDKYHKTLALVNTSFLLDFGDETNGAALDVNVKASTKAMNGIRVPTPPPPPPVIPGGFASISDIGAE